ncbi:MAG TPA: MFS transporter [Verrucomicrobiota bacterium]|nr:MFS transporter [Verrucomicrobiota bacterium]
MPTAAPRLRDITGLQWRSGLAAWLGWMFDGLDMHLYTLVATPFVAELLRTAPTEPSVGKHGAVIQAAFLTGWALGGAFFGRIGDLLGRTRALSLTILTYAAFTGLSVFATEWWHLMIFRFLAALGIGGEWAVGASLLSETWPKSWRPWLAAVLQTGVNCGVLLACLAGVLFANTEPRWIFLVGVLPALLVLWIRRAVPEPAEWNAARQGARQHAPGIRDLFRGEVAKVTWPVLLLCGLSLTAHWTFLFWQQANVRQLPEVASLSPAERNQFTTTALFLVMAGSIVGNFFAGWLAKTLGYSRAIALMLGAYGCTMMLTYWQQPSWSILRWAIVLIGLWQGVFALFTMCLPPLFPTLLRTTGAGFCYNFGRILSAAGVVAFGYFTTVGDTRAALFNSGLLFFPAAVVAFWLPNREAQAAAPNPGA